TKFHCFIRWFLSWLGANELDKTVVNISATREYIENCTINVIVALQEEFKCLSQVVLQNQMALELLLASQRVCTVINTSCCVYIDQTGRVPTDAQ
ncbi:ERVV2 protein, partial [Polioptila caerulea]|nr:ERVV2 protein [Polioptila caerulea]